ncbi:hypothetical protein ACVWWI_006487 [Bradyrhizobium sp. USDA 3686]|nr:hypothetical protein [Bradyrhizobium canariense]
MALDAAAVVFGDLVLGDGGEEAIWRCSPSGAAVHAAG